MKRFFNRIGILLGIANSISSQPVQLSSKKPATKEAVVSFLTPEQRKKRKENRKRNKAAKKARKTERLTRKK